MVSGVLGGSEKPSTTRLGNSVSNNGRTFGAQLFSPLINEWLVPAANGIHDVHVVLPFGREACDGLAIDYRFPSCRVDDARIDRLAMAAVIYLLEFPD